MNAQEKVGLGSRFPRAWKLGMGTLTVAATLSLAACGGGNNNSNGNKNSGGGNNKSSGGAATSSSSGSTAGGSTMMGGGSTMMGGGSTGMMGGTTMMGGGSTMMGGGSTMMGSTGTSGKITSVQAILGAKKPASLVGKKVKLSGVQVQNVASDTAFTVGQSAGKQVPAVLVREVMGKPDKAVNINKGQKVMLRGTVRRIPKAEAALKKFGLTKVPGLNSKKLFIAVQKVKVTGK